MLHGRLPMIRAMPTPKGGTWVDMGGGTGSNLEYFGDELKHFGKVVVLDLCPSLAKQASASSSCWEAGRKGGCQESPAIASAGRTAEFVSLSRCR
jgi:hypothetical protein